jgi:hypothetical protein
VAHVRPDKRQIVFDNERDWLERAFCLVGFPFGHGGPNNMRSRVSRARCIQHYTRTGLPQFQTYDFQLHTYDIRARADMSTAGFVSGKARLFDSTRAVQFSRLQASDLESAADHELKRKRASDTCSQEPPAKQGSSTVATEFIRSVRYGCQAAQHTRAYAKRAKIQDFAICNRFGAATHW